MKKPSNDKITAAKIIAGVVASLTIGANITGCVYGPPPEETAESAPETKTEETVAVEPTVDPDDNINADVYGKCFGANRRQTAIQNSDRCPRKFFGHAKLACLPSALAAYRL